MAVSTSGPALEGAPARADGVELLGEVAGSGYRAAPSLVRRGDGQVLQVTPLLYAVLEAVDGERDAEALAAAVSARTGKQVGAETVRLLLSRLEPLGVLRRPDGEPAAVEKRDPLLGLRFRYVVSDPEATRRITAPFAVLFRPLVVAVVVAAFLLTAGWVLFEKGLAGATAEAFDSPGLLLLVFAVTVLSAGFHEFGHAAACRYGGATPGAMGAGIYLVWPAFYTEVSDSYRLDRWGRVRVDLGGLYFNALFAVASVGVWAVTRYDAVLLLVVTQVLQMVRQLTPIVRFDGYHVLADLTGVPDLYGRIGPTLRGVLPWNWRKPEYQVLRPWARAVVTAWVLVVVPLLVTVLAMSVLLLPRLVATAWASLGRQSDLLAAEWAAGDPAGAAVRMLSLVALALPVLGLGLLLTRLVRTVVALARRWSDGRPLRRAAAVLAAVALLAGLVAAWWPDGRTYTPITRTEQLTVVDLLPTRASARTPLAPGPTSTATTVWGSADRLPTEDEPALALVLAPRDGEGPTWVFPFDRPDAPGPEGNQALAVGTRDGQTVYDVSFALVWVTDGTTAATNEAYAFASCRGCTTVAVAFQVVLNIGESRVAVPQNVSAAVNWSCVQCLTYALASQLFLTVPDGLSETAMTDLQAVWTELEAFGAGLRDVPLGELQARLEAFKARVVEVVERDVAATGGRSATPTPSADAQAGGEPSPEATPSTSPTRSASPAATASPEPTAGRTASTEPTTGPEPVETTAPEPTPTG